VSNIFIKAVSFLLLPLYSNFILPGEFGNYSLIMSFYAVVSVFYQAGLPAGLTKYFTQEQLITEKKKVFSSVFNFVVLLSIILSGAVLLLSGFFSKIIIGSASFANLFLIVSVLLLLDTGTYFLLHLLRTEEKAKAAAVYSLVSALGVLILNILFVYFMRLGITGILYAQLGGSVLLTVILIPEIKPYYESKIDKQVLKMLLLFSLPLIVSGFFSAFLDVADRFFLNLYCGNRITGVYSFAYKIALLMNVFVISFRTAWLPRSIALVREDNFRYTFGNTLTKLISVSGIIFIGVILLVKNLFTLKIAGGYLFNPQYAEGMVILPYILAAYFLNGIASFYSVYPYLYKSSKYLFMADFAAFAVNILLNFILIPAYGMTGAATATLIGYMAMAGYLIAVSAGNIRFKYNYSIDGMTVLSTVVFFLISSAVHSVLIDLVLFIAYIASIIFITRLDIFTILQFDKSEKL
jgi:O-antigen/teichoic acid export membrane protein